MRDASKFKEEYLQLPVTMETQIIEAASEREGNCSENEKAKEKKVVKPKNRHPRMLCNVAHTKYPILRKIVRRDFKMKTSEEDCEDYDLIWVDLGLPPERIMRMKPY
jgi:hypothetical protein